MANHPRGRELVVVAAGVFGQSAAAAISKRALPHPADARRQDAAARSAALRRARTRGPSSAPPVWTTGAAAATTSELGSDDGGGSPAAASHTARIGSALPSAGAAGQHPRPRPGRLMTAGATPFPAPSRARSCASPAVRRRWVGLALWCSSSGTPPGSSGSGAAAEPTVSATTGTASTPSLIGLGRADGAPRRLPGADRGAPARPAAVPRAARRLRPAHHLAPPERARGDRPRARARRLLGLGLRPAGPALVLPRVLELADAAPARRREDRRQRRLLRSAHGDGHLAVPRHDHGHGRHRPAPGRRRDLGRHRAPQALVRVVVRDPLHRLRGDRALLVPHDPRRQRARDRPGRGRLLAQPLRARRSRSSSTTGSRDRSCRPCASTCGSPR